MYNQEVRGDLEFDLREYLLLFRSKAKQILLAAVLGGLLVFVVAFFLIPPRYTSSLSLYVNNLGSNRIPMAGIDLNDLTAAQKLVNTYIVILQNDEVLEEVSRRLAEESPSGVAPFSTEKLRKVVTMEAERGTEVMKISARTTDPQLSARICTLVAEIAPGVLERVVKAGSVEVIGEAKVEKRPAFYHWLPGTLAGFFGSGFAVVMALGLRRALDDTVQSVEDLKKRVEIPILGRVPDFREVSGDG